MTRQELFDALTREGIMLDPCNLNDVSDGSIYYVSTEEMQAIYNDVIADDATRVNCRHEAKHHGKYVLTWYTNDAEQIYNDLTHELIAKKLCSCSYIKSIKRVQLYNGYIRIIVQYDNDCRRIYTITDR